MTSPADVEALKERAVAARSQKFQQEQGIADQATALRRYYQVIVKDAQLPMSVEEQLVLLRKREPEPTGPLTELRQRRLDVTRERLTKVEGIPEARVQALAAPPPRPRRRDAPRPRTRRARRRRAPRRRRRAGAWSSASAGRVD